MDKIQFKRQLGDVKNLDPGKIINFTNYNFVLCFFIPEIFMDMILSVICFKIIQ